MLIIVFHWGELIERLMRPVMVVLMLIALKFKIERADTHLAIVKRVKLIAAGAIGAFHAAVQLGGFGRQHVKCDAELLTGAFELGHEFTAAVNLNRFNLERCLCDQVVQEAFGTGGGGARVGAHEAQSADRAGGFELLDREAGLDAHAHVVELHHLTGSGGFTGGSPALGMAVEPARFSAPGAALVKGCRQDFPAPDPFVEHSADGAFAQLDAVFAGEDGAYFGAAPKGMGRTDLKHPLKVFGIPLPAPHPARPAADGFKPARTFLSEPPAPAVVAGPGPANGFQGGGFAAALFSKLAVQLQSGQSLAGTVRKFGNRFAGAVKSWVQMNGLHRVASCAFCFV